MPDSLLQILKLCLLALILLFFLRVLRAVWAELKPPVAQAPPARAANAPPASRAPGTAAGAAHGSPTGSEFRLRILEPASAGGRVYELGEEMTVGRAAGCGVAVDDGSVSQLHARIFRRDGKLWLEDLGSTNGTWVNAQRVSAAVPLRRGDRLQVGATVMEVTR